MSLGIDSLAVHALAAQPAAAAPPTPGAGSFSMSVDGAAVVNGTGEMPAGINTILLGPGGLDGNTRWKVKRVLVYNRVLTEAELQFITGGAPALVLPDGRLTEDGNPRFTEIDNRRILE